MNIWAVSLRRWDENMTHHKQEETVNVAGETMIGAIRSYLDTRLFYGKPVWKIEHVQSSVLLPFTLDSVQGKSVMNPK